MSKQESAYPDPPGGLSARSQALWRELGPQYARPLGKQVMFQQALMALDRADQSAALIAAEGLVSVTKGSGAVHVNPVVKVEKDARAQFARLWEGLNLSWK